MFPRTLKPLGIPLLLIFSFFITDLSGQCTNANQVENFETDCGTKFSLCVDDEVTDLNTPVVISIFSNDDLGILQMCDVEISVLPDHGDVVLLDNCKMQYTPDNGYVGMDQFKYRFNFWDVCVPEYCTSSGLYIWDIISYYTGPDNVSLDVFAGDRKIGSEALLNNGDLFEVDGSKLTVAENNEWRFVFYDNDCLASGDHCKVIDFEGEDKGRIINNQYAADGVTISAVNNNPSNSHPNLAIIFDSSDPSGEDPDLGTPNEEFGGPGEGTGGESGPGVNDEALGNLLIIAEDKKGSNSDGTVNDPDDEAAGGVITFTFDEPVTVNDMKIIDLENGQQDIIRCYNKAGDLISTQNIGGEGDNSVIVQPVNVDNVSRMEVEFQSSGALDDISYCRPFDCLEKVVVMPTACPASADVIGKEQGDMFRPLSGCVAPLGSDCAGSTFRMPVEVTTFQTAETDVNILIQPGGLLPIEFGSISGTAVGTANHVAWEVVEVVDERFMFLEKSNDGVNYAELTKFGDLRAGDYDATDMEVTSALTYYRVKSISNNGELSYSRSISVNNEEFANGGTKVFPQPASHELHYRSDLKIETVEVIDLSGKRILSDRVDASNYTLNLDGAVTGGIYITKILTEDGKIETKKIVIR